MFSLCSELVGGRTQLPGSFSAMMWPELPRLSSSCENRGWCRTQLPGSFIHYFI
jgi:hypothetical protein